MAAGLKLLVIDDSLTIRKLVELSFKSSTVNVSYAASGEEGIARVQSGRPDIILLDFVLPDMKGIDVCHRLSEDPKTASIAIMVMSAKHDTVRDLFRPYAQVKDFVAKPFKPADIVAAVEAVGARLAPAKVPSSPITVPPGKFSFEQKEAAARALFTHLKGRLASIPTWMGELGANPPAKFFAQRILTSEAMEGLLDALLPVFRERVGAEISRPSSLLEGDALVAGELGTMSLTELLGTLSQLKRSGELTVENGLSGGFEASVLHVHFLEGQAVLATSRNPGRYLARPVLSLAEVDPDIRKKAEAEQKISAKPVYLSIAEAGALPPCDLSQVLNEQGRALVFDAMGEDLRGARFIFRERNALPVALSPHARRVPLEQLKLERLRETAPKDIQTFPPDAVWERVDGFSRKLSLFELSSLERRILTYVDGKCTMHVLCERGGLAPVEASHVLHRLLAVGLLRRTDVDTGSGFSSVLRRKHIMLLEPDVEGFQKPLARLLHRRSVPYDVIPFPQGTDMFSAVKQERPALVILNVEAAGADALRLVKEIRKSSELSDVPVVAVLERPGSETDGELMAAGFDAVFQKPVSYVHIERLLVA